MREASFAPQFINASEDLVLQKSIRIRVIDAAIVSFFKPKVGDKSQEVDGISFVGQM